ncbi:type I polyketide synthase [Micractinium conductrix]|uniref:Type I polyketide synthase n=1 Tax=Micractinium conductrix TaxID=554055 RepID=A0A2P6VKQ7_9CHLO|nr:type I polyketide synthase [Micractinium conductrix]|eukprot:PSC74686.1 type I polyketide synthase [Micractinium conductrix]
MSLPVKQKNPWILLPPPKRPSANAVGGAAAAAAAPAAAEAQPRLSLVCFPPAGAGASVFHGWEKVLPADVQLLPVELPGRGTRLRELALGNMAMLQRELLAALLPELTARPFALFGHSMGAWVAYQLTQELKRRGGPVPLKVYASANRSPLLAGVKHDVHPVVMHQLLPEPFWAAMEHRYGPNTSLAHPAMRRLMLPALQADFQLVETWRPQAGTDSGCGCAPLCGPRPGSAARRSSSDGSSSAARRSSSGGSSSQEGSGSAPGSAARRSSSQEGGGGDGAAAHTAPGSGQPLDGADLDACLHAHPLALPCPLAAIGATQDSRYTRQQLGAWAACAPPGRYEELWLEGGHNYIFPDAPSPGRQQLLDWLAADLEGLLPGAVGRGRPMVDGAAAAASGDGLPLENGACDARAADGSPALRQSMGQQTAEEAVQEAAPWAVQELQAAGQEQAAAEQQAAAAEMRSGELPAAPAVVTRRPTEQQVVIQQDGSALGTQQQQQQETGHASPAARRRAGCCFFCFG